MAGTTKKPHAIFIPYPLQGHLIPSVRLAIKLASKGFTITFINTHSIHHQTSKAQPETGPDIFATVRESGLDIRYTTVLMGSLLGSTGHWAMTSSWLPCCMCLSPCREGGGPNSMVHCLIADTFFVWPSRIAKKFGLLYVSYWTEPALVFALYLSLGSS